MGAITSVLIVPLAHLALSSLFTAIMKFIFGDPKEDTKKIWQEVKDFFTQEFWKAVWEKLDSLPIIGNLKGQYRLMEKKIVSSNNIPGFYHLWVDGNKDACCKSQETATTILIVMLAGFLAVTAGSGLVGAGLVGFFTGTAMDIICSSAYVVWIGNISRLI